MHFNIAVQVWNLNLSRKIPSLAKNLGYFLCTQLCSSATWWIWTYMWLHSVSLSVSFRVVNVRWWFILTNFIIAFLSQLKVFQLFFWILLRLIMKSGNYFPWSWLNRLELNVFFFTRKLVFRELRILLCNMYTFYSYCCLLKIKFLNFCLKCATVTLIQEEMCV